jgi:small subunit ribosomal protein S1
MVPESTASENAASESAASDSAASDSAAPDDAAEPSGATARPTSVRIGSQRWREKNPDVRPKPTEFLIPARPRPAQDRPDEAEGELESPAEPGSPEASGEAASSPADSSARASQAPPDQRERRGKGDRNKGSGKSSRVPLMEPTVERRYPPPNTRSQLSPELEQELADALGNMSLDDMLSAGAQPPAGGELELESRHRARVVAIHRDNVFVDLGGHRQGLLALHGFAEPPEPGAVIDVVISRFNPTEGLYEVGLPGAAIAVEDWSQVAEGMVVEARVTGHNKGGLECEVSNLRGFIPAGQISLYRVEDFSQFVGQKFPCVIAQANPAKGNLVLSRRAVLEREKAEAKANLLAQLEVGQVRDGVVRSLQEFGAFVDLGGVDGLIHISQLSWDRLRHASEALELGQKVRVKIQKIDPETGKISLAYRDLADNPWNTAAQRYAPRSTVRGTVSRLMEFGAFVRLEPGIEGLVHISEISHKRVWRASDVLKEGQEVEVLVLAFDGAQQRISLSLKALEARVAPVVKEPEPEPEPEPVKSGKPRKTPLKGGIGGPSGGDRFGLKW